MIDDGTRGLEPQDAADLALVRRVLVSRGWREAPDDDTCWRWPAPEIQADVRFFQPGPSIYFDEEDPAEGYLVEGPLIEDTATPWLRYRDVRQLFSVLDRIESWIHPQRVEEIDLPHLDCA